MSTDGVSLTNGSIATDVELVLISLNNSHSNRNSTVIVNTDQQLKRISGIFNDDNSDNIDNIIIKSPVINNEYPLIITGDYHNDDDDNSKDNYDMDEADEDHADNDDDDGDEHIKETDELVEKKHQLNDLEDCDYYSDGDGDDDEREEILKCNGGDGIIANHFVGLYHT